MFLDLSALNEQQRQAVTYRGGPLLVLAGAGSGKTRVITYRTVHLLWSQVPADRILVVTFTNKAAGEMRSRILEKVSPRLGKALTLSTFHSFGARWLRKHIHHLGYSPNFSILDEGDRARLIQSVLREVGLQRTSMTARQIARVISRAKREKTNPKGLREMRFSPILPHAQRVFDSYNQHLSALNAVDFDDLLVLPVRLCSENPEVRKDTEQMFDHVMVDEYQDTNSIQVALLKFLCPSGNVAVVGDDDQSIYGFQGALADNILGFEKTFPGARIIKLEQNYRSKQRILTAANALIANNQSRHPKALWSARGQGEKIRFVSCAGEREEAEFVADDLNGACQTFELSPQDIAILYRTNSQSQLFEEALRKRQIPYRVVGSTELFNRAEVKDWLAYLATVTNSRDEVRLRRIVNVPRRGIGPASVRLFEQHARTNGVSLFDALKSADSITGLPIEARDGANQLVGLLKSWKRKLSELRGAKLGRACRDFFEATGLIQHIRQAEGKDAPRRIETLDRLVAGMATTNEDAGLKDYLASLVLDSQRQETRDLSGDRVTLMTLHAAKGLEFRHVYVVGFERKLLPHSKSADSAASIAEERRLCYVGMTRAMERLTLTAARTRILRNERIPRQPSVFLQEIPPDLLATETESLPEPQKERNRDYLEQIQKMLKR